MPDKTELHSHWVVHYINGWYCFECGHYIDDYYGDKPTDICPTCGAIMDEPMTEQTKWECRHWDKITREKAEAKLKKMKEKSHE